MRWYINKLFLIPVLTMFVAVACERAAPTATELDPGTPDELLGGLVGGLLGGNAIPGYTPVKQSLLPGLSDLKLSKLIGVEGGTISLLGATVVVPLGAVSEPTLFTVTLLPTGYVEVDLGATTVSLLGGILDVGGKGFEKLIPVSLSYERATNVSSAKASQIKVLRVHGLLGYKSFEVMPSKVNTSTKTVHTELDHFSRYLLAVPD